MIVINDFLTYQFAVISKLQKVDKSDGTRHKRRKVWRHNKLQT